MTDDLAKILFQPFLREAIVSSFGMGRADSRTEIRYTEFLATGSHAKLSSDLLQVNNTFLKKIK